MTVGLLMAAGLVAGLGLIWIWSLCYAIKQDIEEAKRDSLSADTTADPFHLQGSHD